MQLRVYYWIREYYCHRFVSNHIYPILYWLSTGKFLLFVFDTFKWIKKKKFIDFAKINFWQKSQILHFGLNRTPQPYTLLWSLHYPISLIIAQYLTPPILSKKDCVWNQNFKLFLFLFSFSFPRNSEPQKRNKFANHTPTLCQTPTMAHLLSNHSKRPSLMI